MSVYDIMKGMKMAPDGGASGGGDPAATDPAGNGGADPSNTGGEDKTFTQEQVNSMVAAEKRKSFSAAYKGLGFDSEEAAKEFVEKYKGEEEKNKTDLVKAQERAAQLEAEKNAEASKAQDLQYKFDAVAEGCDTKSAADVVVLAKAKMSEDKDFAAALKEVKEQYPAMFGQTDNGNSGTGNGGTSPRSKTKAGSVSGIGKRLAEQRKDNDKTKDYDYFK